MRSSFGKRLSSGEITMKSHRSQQSRDVERVVKRINDQYARIMNDVNLYKSAIATEQQS